MFISPRNKIILAAIGLAFVAITTGCQSPPPPYVARPVCSKVVYCNDYTGHQTGSKPWVLGGTCCCTPSEELMTQLHRDGICTDMDADQLADAYKAKSIALRGKGHQHCNGLCADGPHVVLGGKCMCPPTPGTEYYDRVISGRCETATLTEKTEDKH